MQTDSPYSIMIKTKYCIPRASRCLISRRRLNNKLDDSLKHLITLVVAPLGYGKTTAVYEWLLEAGRRASWLSLDAGDNDPHVFWRYVCAALEDAAPGILGKAGYAISSRELMQANVHLNIIIDMLADSGGEVLLVIDDLHMISNPLILKGLAYLLDFSPANLHFIFLSRSEPGLELPKFEIRGQVIKISAADLFFREKEISQYFMKCNTPLEPEMLRRVWQYTEGWAVAVAAVAVSVRNLPDGTSVLEGMVRGRQDIERYLLGEVMRTFSSEQKEFVVKTSLLETLCGELCNTVTGMAGTEAILEQMCNKDEFVLQLDSGNHVYRYAHIFRDYAYALLKDEYGDCVPELHCRAALWYHKVGRLHEAVLHYLKGAKYSEALQIFEPLLGGLAGANAYDTVFTWLNLLPEQYINNNIGIALFYSLYHAEQRNFENSHKWLNRARELYANHTPTFIKIPADVPIWLSALNLSIREGKLNEMLSLIGSVSNEKMERYKMKGFFEMNPADIYFYRSSICHYVKIVATKGALGGIAGGSSMIFMAPDPGYHLLAEGEYYYEQNLLEQARPPLLEAELKAQAAGNAGVLVPAMAGLARIKRAGGDIRGAIRLVERCERLLEPINKPHWNYMACALKHRYLLEIGDAAAVNKWAATNRLNIYTELNNAKEFELLVYARVLMYKNRIDDAEALLVRLLSFAESRDRTHSAVEILNLLALLSDKAGERINAVRYMEKSLRHGAREDYFRSFVDEGRPLISVLEQVRCEIEKRTDPDTAVLSLAKRIIEQIRLEADAASDGAVIAAPFAAIRPLTPKELEVLGLLYAAYSNNEIAQHLKIGLRTVKTHTGSIYGKLGVTSRTQCIQRVRELGLFEK